MLDFLGWQVGINYQAPAREGLSRDYLLCLLDQMARARMNLLSLMMVSQAFHDPEHDGYAWPVRISRLRCYMDAACHNAQPDGEFVSEVIEAAAQRGIAVQLFLTGPWWTPERIRQGYPDAHQVVSRVGELHEAFFCLDAPGTWRACLDEATDLLRFYDHPNVRSFAFEMFGFPECYCPYTRQAFRDAFTREMEEVPTSLLFGTPLDIWNANRTRAALRRFVAALRQIRPDIEIWVHTQGVGNGHFPHIFPQAGVDCLLPLDHFFTREAEAHQLLQFLSPNPCVVHLCARASQPRNYPLPPKTPELIRRKIDWYANYVGDNLRGILFFNEPAVPLANKEAVYAGIRARLR